MRNALSRARQALGRLHRNEGGATMVEYLLIVAVVALPLIAIILIFRNELWQWVDEQWNVLRSDPGVPDN